VIELLAWKKSNYIYFIAPRGPQATGDRQGHFYLDLHPRVGKYGHAAIFHLLKRSGDQTPVDCMLCNLPAPATDGPRKGKPALLLHSNVVTFFHEFGSVSETWCLFFCSSPFLFFVTSSYSPFLSLGYYLGKFPF
jgi:hypothetical protein